MKFYDGIYRITPLGEHTTFQCLIKNVAGGLVIVDLKTFDSLEVSVDLVRRMKPVFIRKEDDKP